MNFIYLHGFTSGPTSFKAQYFSRQMAAMGLNLHVPDLNGDDFEGLTMTRQLQQIERLCDGLSGEITLIGSSLGGYLAALYAEDEPRVQKIILMAPAFRFVSHHFECMADEKVRRWQQEGTIPVYHHFYQRECPLDYGLIEDARHYDQAPLLRQIPALVFHGKGDETVPYRLSQAYQEENGQAIIHLLDDDHGLARSLEFMWQESTLFMGLGQAAPHPQQAVSD